jgi:hypothetical protein
MADLQHFHLFPGLPFEIREMVWMSSFPDARSIRARPVLEALSWIYHNRKSRQVLDVKFSYEDSNPIVALRTSRESCQAALSVYRPRVTEWGIIYFYPNRNTILFAGFETVFETLISHGSRPASIAQLLITICERKASQFPDSSKNVE